MAEEIIVKKTRRMWNRGFEVVQLWVTQEGSSSDYLVELNHPTQESGVFDVTIRTRQCVLGDVPTLEWLENNIPNYRDIINSLVAEPDGSGLSPKRSIEEYIQLTSWGLDMKKFMLSGASKKDFDVSSLNTEVGMRDGNYSIGFNGTIMTKSNIEIRFKGGKRRINSKTYISEAQEEISSYILDLDIQAGWTDTLYIDTIKKIDSDLSVFGSCDEDAMITLSIYYRGDTSRSLAEIRSDYHKDLKTQVTSLKRKLTIRKKELGIIKK